MLCWSAAAVMFGNGDTLPLAITGLESSVENGRTYLSAVSANGGALLRFEIGSAGTLVAQGSLPLPAGQNVADGLIEVAVGGRSYFAPLAPLASAMPGLTLLDPTGGSDIVLGDAGTRIASVAAVDVGGTSFLLVAHADSGAVDTFARTGSGPFALATRTTAQPGGTGLAALVVASAGGTAYVITALAADDSIRSSRILADGSLAEVDRDGAPGGLGLDAPSATGWTTLDGETYVLQAGAGSSSLSVLRLETDGRLTPTDHVVDNLATRFQSVTALAIVEDGTRRYVIAGGADGGLSAFALLPGGRLYHLGAIADTASLTLAAVSEVAAAMAGGRIQIFAASGSEVGFTHLELALGITGDIVAGTDAGERISGTTGADILLDGAGSDVLIGGSGADVFVLDYDGASDTIADFDPAMDRLDLSGWTLLRSADQLDVTATTFGATIRHRGEVLHIHSVQGTQLTAADFARIGVANLDRILTGFVDGAELEGTASNDRLTGTAAKDRLIGYDGNDILDGAGGADTLIGGTGLDCADFSWASTPLIVDLSDPGENGGAAIDVILDGIEGVIGGTAADVLRGDASSNRLSGGPGNDWLVGRGGDDHVVGGSGSDRLSGGAGSDYLDGGAGRDYADYWDEGRGMTADLLFPSLGTGSAAGDMFTSIEGFVGSALGDTLRGDNAQNFIFGGSGADVIVGRGGDDQLFGGGGSDLLMGGTGADILDGGAGRDWALYSQSLVSTIIDMMNPGAGTGEAAGDVLVNVEAIGGTFHDDDIRGDDAQNFLLGRSGHDVIHGRGGDDHIYGEGGNDALSGGSGNDYLSGGGGADAFIFDGGNDMIGDFSDNIDTLWLDSALWGGAARTVSDVLSAASMVSGSVVLDFGGGNSLALTGLTSVAYLIDDVVIF